MFSGLLENEAKISSCLNFEIIFLDRLNAGHNYKVQA